MVGVQRWCRVTVLGPDGAALCGGVLEGPGDPDLGAVDEVAHLALDAIRRGGAITLTEVSDPMRRLLELAGLSVDADGPVEVQRQAELREQPFRVEEVEEEVHPGDLPP
jgi:hypothetical protein